MEKPKILSTLDYSIFNLLDFNRDKNKLHINNLKRAVQNENLLHLHPILVNEKMEVVDGQHRLAVAEELNVPIYYIQSDLSYTHVLNSNLFQNKLRLDDIIKYYSIKDHKEAYIKFREYMNKLDLTSLPTIALLFGTITKMVVGLIKSGDFILPADTTSLDLIIDRYLNFFAYVTQKRVTPLQMFKRNNFLMGFRNLILSAGFNEKVFFNKLDQKWFELKPQTSSAEWTKKLLEIYNWRSQNPLIIADLD